ncbi:MAG: tyrosine--tRNA ligase [Candidatus Eisenbacteria bacterium]|uniref:Tyrosine--tRNA ligase n=1 Tax=Eiseniibacteriota bacterium TaxID=2212470 RepID=A0A956M2B4_UNCEI|nr:tyrosine--tRNA ligase [Candidatus Eisenbacteria bacterium]
MNVEEQLEILLRGTHFPDEGGDEATGFDAASPTGSRAPHPERAPDAGDSSEVDGDAAPKGLRAQMTAELRERLATGKPLRVYLGADPTAPSLHVGHFVPVQKLRVFQELGHQVIFLIGDYTAVIGDPTGQATERRRFTHDQVRELAKDYQRQAFRILDPKKTEVRYNGDWLSKLSFLDVVELATIFPLKWVVSRHDFAARLQKGESLRLHETLYCLMQGYDAHALECDVQVGGYDQYMNMLAGRWIQEYFGKKPHIPWTFPLLMGTDGRKMSKSFGNAINLLDTPEDMYGKVMRVADELLPSYIDLTTDFNPSEAEALKARLREPGVNPMEIKKQVARNLVVQYWGEESATGAAASFQQIVQDKAMPDELEELSISAGGDGTTWPDLLAAWNVAKSKGEARRLMSQGGFYVDQASVTDPMAPASAAPGTIIRLGKRRWFKLVP